MFRGFPEALHRIVIAEGNQKLSPILPYDSRVHLSLPTRAVCSFKNGSRNCLWQVISGTRWLRRNWSLRVRCRLHSQDTLESTNNRPKIRDNALPTSMP